MAKILCIASTKGGVGKSTIADNIAVCAALDNKKVLTIDADTQRSTMLFRGAREKDDIQSVSITQPTIHKDIDNFSNFDLIIIDAGGRDNAVFRSAISAAVKGMLLIPVLPSQYDIWATEDTFNMLKEIKVYLDIKAYSMFNQVIPNTNIAKEAHEALEDMIKEYDIKLLNTIIYHRIDFKNSISYGKGVIEYKPHSKSSDEIKALYEEIKTILEV